MIVAREQERYFTPEEYFAWEEHLLEKHERSIKIDEVIHSSYIGTKFHLPI